MLQKATQALLIKTGNALILQTAGEEHRANHKQTYCYIPDATKTRTRTKRKSPCRSNLA